MKQLLGPDVGYVDILNEVTREKLSKERAEGKHFQKSPIRPSAAGACTRELYFQLSEYAGKAKYETEADAPETHRLFSLGHYIESHLVKQFEMLADFVAIRYKQQTLSFTFLDAKNDKKLSQWLEGSLDLVFWSEKYKCVADVKSKKDKFSSSYATAWNEFSAKLSHMQSVTPISGSAFWVEDLEEFLTELNDPFFSANFLQLNLYANSDFLKERGVNHAAIIQYSKNDSRLREVRFKPSEKLYKQVIQKFKNVVKAVDENKPELAKRDYVLGSIKCAFCKYSKECWDKDTRTAYFKTLGPKKWPTDTNRLGVTGMKLEKLFSAYEELTKKESEKDIVEDAILKLLLDGDADKVRLENGHVYELKRLKNEVKIKRSKV